ncbi:MAG: DEAD/DEAH box helicase [Phaeodactylibacter sp.]|nr:DEAD/DEAH box helicase [Phaeodactylibacter sp.]
MINQWQYSTLHNAPCQVLEEKALWGQTVCRVWLPNQEAVVRVPRSALRPLDADLQPGVEGHRIGYIAAAAKVADVLDGSAAAAEGHILLAPIESNVIPLPHQIHALSRAIAGDQIRYLLADEVGLGKTVEAGLIIRELKLRGLVRRTLVVVPKGLATQWVAEMQHHFNETFQLVLGEDIGTLQRLAQGGGLFPEAGHSHSPWSMFDQVVVSLDSVKPIDKRRGWPAERIAEYNRSRFEGLVSAGWDLVIVDEAHRLGGSTDQVARYKLGLGLAEAAPYLLLLSATPHQGKADAFHRLMNLLDSKAFPDMDSVSRNRVAPYVIRTEKRKAVDAGGNPLFKPRRTQMVGISWEPRHHLQQLLYEAVTDYVREGYNQALQEKKQHFGFLMILMQRLVVSSTRSIRTTLERRLGAIMEGERLASLRLNDFENSEEEFEELYDMDGEALLDQLLQSHIAALQNEGEHVQTLLDAARRCEQAGPDAKAEALIEWIYQLQRDEDDPDLKVLIFTEFVPTQQMLREFLEARGMRVATLNGSMDMDERRRAQDAFRNEARILVSTDAGGEGLNLQFCHVVINYDIPWNPMRLEQRIGRVDRIGQPKTVRALNFVFEDSVEFRVREVLEQKLSVIFEEFGIDKTGDVLDSAFAGELFEEAFASVFVDPESIESSVEETVARLREELVVSRESAAVYSISDKPDIEAAERLRSHPLPYWVERMTVSYLNAHGGKAVRKRAGWELAWPDGRQQYNCVFSAREADLLAEAAGKMGRSPDATLLTLENNEVRGLAFHLPQVAAGQPLPCVALSGLPAGLSGAWGLFEIRLQAGLSGESQLLRIPSVRKGYFCVFRTEEGKVFLPTARHIWDTLQTAEPQVLAFLSQEESLLLFDELLKVAEEAGQDLFDALQVEHRAAIAREEERGASAFYSRRRVIDRVGLPEVRQYRMDRCDAEEAEWRLALESARQAVPEIRPLLLLRIVKAGAYG